MSCDGGEARAERALIEQQTNAAHIDTSTYMRAAALGRKKAVDTASAIRDLSTIGKSLTLIAASTDIA